MCLCVSDCVCVCVCVCVCACVRVCVCTHDKEIMRQIVSIVDASDHGYVSVHGGWQCGMMDGGK